MSVVLPNERSSEMTPSPKASIVALALLALAGCSKAEAPVVDTAAAMTPAATSSAPASAADKEAVAAVNVAWFKAYNAHDVDAISALYADDAVLAHPASPPRAAPRRSRTRSARTSLPRRRPTSPTTPARPSTAWSTC